MDLVIFTLSASISFETLLLLKIHLSMIKLPLTCLTNDSPVIESTLRFLKVKLLVLTVNEVLLTNVAFPSP